MKRAGRKLRLPRRIHPGTVRSERPGEQLHCLVLARAADEWVGVDIATGAFVRAPGFFDVEDPGRRRSIVVGFTIGPPEGPIDPSRPELVVPLDQPEVIGSISPRAARRFLRKLATPESKGATILGTRGPSIAFVDLDANASSLQLLALGPKRLELGLNDRDEPDCSIPWGGTTQRTRLVDPVASAAAAASGAKGLRGSQITAAIGFRPNFVLVGLGRVSGGHAPKLVFALL